MHGPFDIHSLYCSNNAPTGSTRFHFHAGYQEKIHHGGHGEHRGSLKLLLEIRELPLQIGELLLYSREFRLQARDAVVL